MPFHNANPEDVTPRVVWNDNISPRVSTESRAGDLDAPMVNISLILLASAMLMKGEDVCTIDDE